MLYREAGQYKTSYPADMAIFSLRQDRMAFALLMVFAFVFVPLMGHFRVPPFPSLSSFLIILVPLLALSFVGRLRFVPFDTGTFFRAILILFLIVALLGYFKITLFANDYIFRAILIPFLILSLAAIGVNVLVGYCGQISLGSGAFMAIGAYSAYKFGTGLPEIGLPPLPVIVSIFLGGACSAFVGILFGIPSLRIKGLYLAVATLAAQFFFDWVFLRVKWFTNYAPSGSVNAPELNLFGLIIIDSPIEKYLFVLTFLVIFAWLVKNLVRSSVGRQWMAIRDMDIAAELMGIRPIYAKLSAFAVSSFIVGIAGALWAFVYLGSWEPLAFSIDRSLQLLFMIIIGGLGSILGSLLGAAFILIVPIMLNLVPTQLGVPLSTETITHLEFIIFGSLICYLLIVEPHGFARLWQIVKERLRLWPFPY